MRSLCLFLLVRIVRVSIRATTCPCTTESPSATVTINAASGGALTQPGVLVGQRGDGSANHQIVSDGAARDLSISAAIVGAPVSSAASPSSDARARPSAAQRRPTFGGAKSAGERRPGVPQFRECQLQVEAACPSRERSRKLRWASSTPRTEVRPAR